MTCVNCQCPSAPGLPSFVCWVGPFAFKATLRDANAPVEIISQIDGSYLPNPAESTSISHQADQCAGTRFGNLEPLGTAFIHHYSKLSGCKSNATTARSKLQIGRLFLHIGLHICVQNWALNWCRAFSQVVAKIYGCYIGTEKSYE